MPWLGPVSLRQAVMLSCDAAVTPIVMDDNGNPLDVGLTTRTIPRRIRRALVKITDYYDEALEPSRATSGVKLPTAATPPDARKIKPAGRVFEHSPMPLPLAVLERRLAVHKDLEFFSRVVERGELFELGFDERDPRVHLVDEARERRAFAERHRAALAPEDIFEERARRRQDRGDLGGDPRRAEGLAAGPRARAAPAREEAGAARERRLGLDPPGERRLARARIRRCASV